MEVPLALRALTTRSKMATRKRRCAPLLARFDANIRRQQLNGHEAAMLTELQTTNVGGSAESVE